MQLKTDLEMVRIWLNETCHCAHKRTIVGRALEYCEALERAGLSPINVTGEDLYAFLTDDTTTPAFRKHFPQPTL